MNTDSGYLDVESARIRCKCDQRTIRRAIKSGALAVLPSSAQAGRYILATADVDAWHNRNKIPTGKAAQPAQGPYADMDPEVRAKFVEGTLPILTEKELTSVNKALTKARERGAPMSEIEAILTAAANFKSQEN